MKKNPLRTHDFYRERVNSQLDLFLGSIKSTKNSKNRLKDVMRYSALAGGKRFRSILTYTVASLYDLAIEKQAIKFLERLKQFLRVMVSRH
jgi:farnesyl diphosphate synthase/geranylgeranyl diphosphate synthase type II